MNGPLINPDEGSAAPELYIFRRPGTAGLTHALRRNIESHENRICLYLFTTQLGALEYLNFMGLDPDQWELAGSEEFGGVASLLREALWMCTHMVIDPPLEHGALIATPTIEYAIDCFESLPAEESNSGRAGAPFWLLIDEAKKVFGIEPEPRVMAVCLFKTEMDAEEFRHSLWLPADEWESDGPANPDDAVTFLEEISRRGISHVVINVPPGGAQRPSVTPIEVIIDHVTSRGHIQDLD